MKLTSEIANRLFEYNPETGVLMRRGFMGKCISAKRLINKPAGFIHSNGYLEVNIDHANFGAHRVIWLMMTGKWPNDQIDHINGDRSDNRWENLRDVTCFENHQNQRISKNNKTGITGVSFLQSKKTWHATIYVNGKNKYLYSGKDFFEACCRRKSAEIMYGFHPNHGTAR